MKLIGVAQRIIAAMIFSMPLAAFADNGLFDMERWDMIMDNVRTRAAAQNISKNMIQDTLKSPAFIPGIVKNDKNQSEFKLTLSEYLTRTVNNNRVQTGKKMRAKYPTMLARVESKYGVPPHVILAFWGMESNFGATKARYKLTDAFLTLMYDGRRETFFGNQLIALMKIADDNGLDINEIRGSWAGAIGHFQFIPTTLASYGVDGNGDGKIDIINSVGDAMHSAGNYLGRLGWNSHERIARRVSLPADFDTALLDGGTKKPLSEWAAMGVSNPDGTPIPVADMSAGLVADIKEVEQIRAENATESGAMYGTAEYVMDTDTQPQKTITAYLTYPNFYRIKKWNNSNWYAIAIAELADKLK